MLSPIPESVDIYLGRPLAGHKPPEFLGTKILGWEHGALPELLEVVLAWDTEEYVRWWCQQSTTQGSWEHCHATSADTPLAVCYASRSVYVYRYGRLFVVAHLSRWVPLPENSPAPFPTMRRSL